MTDTAATTTPSAAANQGLSKGKLIASWIARLAVAGIFAMTASMKLFTDASTQLADALGVGRMAVMGIGAAEALALVLILLPKTKTYGAILTLLLMAGALVSHATKLGFSGDLGGMWPMAVVVALAAAAVLFLNKGQGGK